MMGQMVNVLAHWVERKLIKEESMLYVFNMKKILNQCISCLIQLSIICVCYIIVSMQLCAYKRDFFSYSKGFM